MDNSSRSGGDSLKSGPQGHYIIFENIERQNNRATLDLITRDTTPRPIWGEGGHHCLQCTTVQSMKAHSPISVLYDYLTIIIKRHAISTFNYVKCDDAIKGEHNIERHRFH